MGSMQKATHALEKRGIRLTTQRRAILDVITTYAGQFTAEDIYEAARQIHGHVSLTTVYRSLAILLESGVIKQRYLSVEHDRSYYELATALDRFYFRCRQCGKLIEIKSPETISALYRQLAAERQIAEVTQICACLEGICEPCARAGKASVS